MVVLRRPHRFQLAVVAMHDAGEKMARAKHISREALSKLEALFGARARAVVMSIASSPILCS